MATIVSPSKYMRLAVRIVEELELRGATEQQLELLVADPNILDEVMHELTVKLTIPEELNIEACRELVHYLLPVKPYTADGTRQTWATGIYADELEWLAQPEQMKILLQKLNQDELGVVVARSGLDNEDPRKLEPLEAAHKLDLEVRQITRLRRIAISIMRDQAVELLKDMPQSAKYL